MEKNDSDFSSENDSDLSLEKDLGFSLEEDSVSTTKEMITSALIVLGILIFLGFAATELLMWLLQTFLAS